METSAEKARATEAVVAALKAEGLGTRQPAIIVAVNRLLPILDWLPSYGRKELAGDLPAGLTVGVMLIPQGMAYAMIAGLPVVYGLYAALAPQVIYALMGTSRTLAVGPVAMDSLLVASGLAGLAVVGSERYIELALLLALLMGLIQFALGALRLGFLSDFLSRPVISGFTSAAALIIGFNQLGNLLGMPLHRSAQLHQLLGSAVGNLSEAHLPTVALSAMSIGVLLVLNRVAPRIPSALVVVVLGAVSVALGWVTTGTIGPVPSGLPAFHIPDVHADDLRGLFPVAATLALVAFMEAFSVAKSIAEKARDHEVDADQELRALGTANAIGSLFGAYPTSGGFSRTAVNHRSGARTGVSALIAAAIVALTLAFLTDLFHFLPKASLGAIIAVAVVGLFDLAYFRTLWRTHRDEAALMLATFFITAFGGMVMGIAAGVALSLTLTLYRTSRPHTAELGAIGGVYRNLNRFPKAIKAPGQLIIRYDGPLNYASQSHFKDHLQRRLDIRENEGDPIRRVVLSAKSIPHLDASACAMLDGLLDDFASRGIDFHWSGTIGPVRDVLQRSGLMDRIGRDHFHSELSHAMGKADPDPQNGNTATQSFRPTAD